MRSRIARSIVGVAALVVVVLGVPLAIVIQRFYESRATVELQRSAAEAIVELQVPLDAAEIADAAREPDAPSNFSVYDDSGARLFGPGPARLDAPLPGELVVISPVTDRTTENVVGSVLVSRSESSIAAEARRAWALMALAAIGGLGLAWFVARREAARLTAPISELATSAERLGDGEFDVTAAPTGTPELDTLAGALAISGRRLAEMVAREREFSANASHQLRTPLAGLRVSLERGDTAAARAEADRLSATVDHLLDLARNAMPATDVIDVGAVLAGTADRWQPVFRTAGRELDVTIGPRLPGVRARPTSVEQAVDVLLENSIVHGAGRTRLTARTAAGGLVIQVDDDGPGIDASNVESVFDRHHGADLGIGLALARALVEADAGRLVLSDPDRAEFRIVLAAAATSEPDGDVDQRRRPSRTI
jgi:signal transduction histidine kinase